tara:strand:- start:34212 stop:34502 length:291 start_codon:yes stop_codon:yes gene_type:complete
MVPTLQHGDYVIAKRNDEAVSMGTVVVIQHPNFGNIVKRVISQESENLFRVQGDNPDSTTSETIGPIDQQAINGEVRWRISRKGMAKFRPDWHAPN